MCGITGVVSFDGVSDVQRHQVTRATAALTHRGPDDVGCFADQCVALGMRRLAIIDIAGGHQPMVTPDGRFAIVLNGEIYNFQSLRKDLASHGVVFRTASDTEVLLHHLARYGIDGLAQVNGMFAFAFWDRDARVLILARDRLGEKPLYYARVGSKVCFASELQALRCFDDIDDAIDPEAVFHYFTFMSVPAPLSILRGVRKLGPGHYLRISEAGVSDLCYWRPPAVRQPD